MIRNNSLMYNPFDIRRFIYPRSSGLIAFNGGGSSGGNAGGGYGYGGGGGMAERVVQAVATVRLAEVARLQMHRAKARGDATAIVERWLKQRKKQEQQLCKVRKATAAAKAKADAKAKIAKAEQQVKDKAAAVALNQRNFSK